MGGGACLHQQGYAEGLNHAQGYGRQTVRVETDEYAKQSLEALLYQLKTVRYHKRVINLVGAINPDKGIVRKGIMTEKAVL